MRVKMCAACVALFLLLTGCGGGTGMDSTGASAGQAADALRVWCFQAGKADAFLFWNADGAVLLDTGDSGFGKTILEKLSELGISRLDYLIITHFDKDHVGGAKKILSEIPVGTVLQSNSPKPGAEAYEKYVGALQTGGIEPITVRSSLRFSLGDACFTVDPPALEHYPEDASNNSSLIVSVTHGANRMLFCGDAADQRLTEYLEGAPGRFALVKLPHHGRYQESLRALLEESRPAYVVVTASDEEPEDAETLALLEAYGTEVLLTRSGPIQIVSTPEGLTAGCAD